MKKPMILATALTALLAVPFAHAEDLPGKGVKSPRYKVPSAKKRSKRC